VLIEGAEESGSPGLVDYLAKLKPIFRDPRLVILLDLPCGDYERWWTMSSFRGILCKICFIINLLVFEIKVKVLSEQVHTGDAGGIVPESFTILRNLLNRIEDSATGDVIEDFQVEVPEKNRKQIHEVAKSLKESVHTKFPFFGSTVPMCAATDPVEAAEELLINNMWRTSITYVGADGLPQIPNAGCFLRPETAIRISMRTAPTLDIQKAKQRIEAILTENPPFGAKIEVKFQDASPGMSIPDLNIPISRAISAASYRYFGKRSQSYAAGGTIPITLTIAKTVLLIHLIII
jgi:acetylornithine deacetylase/succinyl-diaminopimelate desuccinylase-like protein